jgi:hypothetical protein
MSEIWTVANAIDDRPLVFKTDDGAHAVAIFKTETLAYDFSSHRDASEANAPFRIRAPLQEWLADMERLNNVARVAVNPTPDTIKYRAVPIDVLLAMLDLFL